MPFKDPEEQRRYQRDWMAKRRRLWLLDKVCVMCGGVEELEVDHIDPSKKVSHRIFSWSRKRREAELAKCQVLCNDCHKKKTQTDRPPVLHGSRRMWQLGCRCDVCRVAQRDHMRKFRSNKACSTNS